MFFRQKRKSYEEKEQQALIKKYRGVPPFWKMSRTSTRATLKIPSKLHTKGEIVDFRGSSYLVTDVTNKGIFVQQIVTNDDLAELEKEKVFISDKDIMEGKLYPQTRVFYY